MVFLEPKANSALRWCHGSSLATTAALVSPEDWLGHNPVPNLRIGSVSTYRVETFGSTSIAGKAMFFGSCVSVELRMSATLEPLRNRWTWRTSEIRLEAKVA